MAAVDTRGTQVAVPLVAELAKGISTQSEVTVAEKELALLEVRGMSGEALLKSEFKLSDRVFSVKERIQKARGIPVWQQMLSFQAEILNDQSRLKELSLPHEDLVFEIALKSIPSPSLEEMEALIAFGQNVLAGGRNGLGNVSKGEIQECRALANPRPPVVTICRAVLHLLAGLEPEIPIKQDGSPTNDSWGGCRAMMKNTHFLRQVLELPSHIDEGRLMKKRVVACRKLIDTLEGNSESDKIQIAARASRTMCQQLLRFLFGLVKYYDGVAEFRERFGGATVTDLKSRI
jgi:hypothetical protein